MDLLYNKLRMLLYDSLLVVQLCVDLLWILLLCVTKMFVLKYIIVHGIMILLHKLQIWFGLYRYRDKPQQI